MKQRINANMLNSILLAQFLAVSTSAEVEAAFARTKGAAEDDVQQKHQAKHPVPQTFGRTRHLSAESRNEGKAAVMLRKARRTKETSSAGASAMDGSETKSPKSTKSPSSTKSPKSTKSPNTSDSDEVPRAPTLAPTAVPTTAPTSAPTAVPTIADTAPTSVPTAVPTSSPTSGPTIDFVGACAQATDPVACGRLENVVMANALFKQFFDDQTDAPGAFRAAYNNPAFLDAIEDADTTSASFYIGTDQEIFNACSNSATATCCQDSGSGNRACYFDGIGLIASNACTGDQYTCDTRYNAGGSGETIGANIIVMPGSCDGTAACQYLHGNSIAPTFIGAGSCTGSSACNSLGSEMQGPVSINANSCTNGNACYSVGSRATFNAAVVEYAGIGSGSCQGVGSCYYVHAYSSSGSKVDGSVRIGDNACVAMNACNGLGQGDGFTDDLLVEDSQCPNDGDCQQACTNGVMCGAGEAFFATAGVCSSGDTSTGCMVPP